MELKSQLGLGKVNSCLCLPDINYEGHNYLIWDKVRRNGMVFTLLLLVELHNYSYFYVVKLHTMIQLQTSNIRYYLFMFRGYLLILLLFYESINKQKFSWIAATSNLRKLSCVVPWIYYVFLRSLYELHYRLDFGYG